MKTTNNTVLLIGGSAGIGLEIARLFSDNNNHVIITGRDKQRLEKAAATLKNVTPIVSDFSDENDIEKLGEVQRDLLCRAAGHLSHDGILLYCTCSSEPEEGENQIDSFLNQNKDFRQITEIPSAVHPYLRPGINNVGFRTNPHVLQDKGGMDGFFIALLKKI